MSTITNYDKTSVPDDGSKTAANKGTYRSIYTNLTDPIKTFVEANLEKVNKSATSAPTATDDSGDSYGVSSLWIDTSNDRAYVCVDATAGSAIWKELDNPRNNFSATAAPTATDDANDSPAYAAGSLWVDVSNDKAYINLDASAGAAVWSQIGALKDIDSLSTATGVSSSSDYVPIWDDSANAVVKTLVSNISNITVTTSNGAVATGTTVMPNDDTIPQNTEGDEYMSLAITPTNTNSKLIIDVKFFASHTAGSIGVAALFQDSTADALAATSWNIATANRPEIVNFRHIMTAGTTSSTTFKLRAGSGSAGTFTFNGKSGGRLFGGVAASSITITEIAP